MLELSTLISRLAQRQAHHEAIVFDDRRLTWGEFARRVARGANALRALGVAKGDRVATATPNCLQQLEIYWACPTLGAVLVPLSPLMQEAGLAALLRDCQPKCVLCSADQQGGVIAAVVNAGLQGVTQIVVTGEAMPGSRSYESLCAASSEAIEPVAVDPDDLFNIMYTSGTTGTPKGIMHTHRIRAMYAFVFSGAMGIDSESVVVQSGALVFNGAFTTMLPLFLHGGRYVLMPCFEVDRFIDLVENEQATHVGLVPSQIVALLNSCSFVPERLASLKSIMSVGAPLLQVCKDRLNELLPGRLCEIYGLTEGFATFLSRRDAQRKSGSVGVPLPFSAMRIVREDGGDCATGETGEIVGRGPLFMTGYSGRPDLTAQAVRDGWLHTGDMGYVDGEGFLYLVDRKKDMIDSGGIKVYPKDIEEIAAQHPAIREVAVFGVPDDKWGETPVAAVLLTAQGAARAEEIRAWINQRVAAKYQRVSRVVILEDFPRNVAGKTLKRELREPYWRDTRRNI